MIKLFFLWAVAVLSAVISFLLLYLYDMSPTVSNWLVFLQITYLTSIYLMLFGSRSKEGKNEKEKE
ncbi:hypothetical protein BN2127_JRS3_03680 [Bacillus safensis]|uniref:hypothetical protein n=1 Tax=Bacillus TaxID=1386 RepID=UPI0006A8DE56|nr:MULTISPECIES: hypothetical protein [Bacillus]CUB24007.1 hypothetical protein BN2127_JRS3_03680 [Bacillus safensis]